MQETRRARLAAVIQEELSLVVRSELKDPRVPPLTFTSVEVTPDGGQATVQVMLLGATATVNPIGEEDQAPPSVAEQEQAQREHRKRVEDCLQGLNSASGFLRRHLAKVLTVRHIPNLIFREDRGLENSLRVHALLKKINQENP